MKASKEVHLILLKDAFFGIVDNFSDISLIYFCLESLWSPDLGLGTPERKLVIFLLTKFDFLDPLRPLYPFGFAMIFIFAW